MRVLIASGVLDTVGGVQACTRDLAYWLLAHGHTPIVYAAKLGDVARELTGRTVAVTDDLRTIGIEPDIIHGHTALQTVLAMLAFPRTPGIFTCHGWIGAEAAPPHLPQLLRYIAVDDTCADRLLLREGVAEEKIEVLLNGVDTQRFAQRGELPARPRRALLFSNTAHELTHLPAIREACHLAGIELHAAGRLCDRTLLRPEESLHRYDLVFAKGKCALEAMASGAAVILCDVAGLGGMVRSQRVPQLQRLNFGMRTLNRKITSAALLEEINAFDPADARRVSNMIRGSADAEHMHQRLLAIYSAVIEEYRTAPPTVDAAATSRAAAFSLQSMVIGQRTQWSTLTPVLQASQRVMNTPLIGPLLSRGARWILAAARR